MSLQGVQYAGEYEVSHIRLISSSGTTLPIEGAVVQLDFMEDIFTNSIFGAISVVDTNDLVHNMPIVGQEFLDIKIKTPTLNDEIDNIFKAMHREYLNNDASVFFIKDDKPGIIEIFGDRRERIEIVKLYIDAEGDGMAGGNLIDEDMLNDMKALSGVWGGVDPEEHSHLRKALEKQIKEDQQNKRNLYK